MATEQAVNKQQALDRTLAQIEKVYGSGAIMKMTNMRADVEGVGTGALSLDLALGGSGLPRGRVVELFGPEASGKTTLALHVAACAQQEGGVAAFVDAEHALDPRWARTCGINIEQLLVSQPDSGEEALEITEMLVRSGAIDVVVVDSVAALIPRAEIEGQMGDTHVALQARLMSQALRKLTAAVSKTRTVIVFINQIRMKIGVMFGNPETTPGGRALKFYSSIRLDVRRVSTIKEGDIAIGNHVRAKVVKNKVAAPFRQAEFDIMFDGGISKEGDLLDLALASKAIEKSGAWFSYKAVRLGQGRENVKTFLRDNPDLFDEIRSVILKQRAEAAADAEPDPGKKASAQRPTKSAAGATAKAPSNSQRTPIAAAGARRKR